MEMTTQPLLPGLASGGTRYTDMEGSAADCRCFIYYAFCVASSCCCTILILCGKEILESVQGNPDQVQGRMGVPTGQMSPGEWVKEVAKKYNAVDWTKLTVTQRKDSLYYLYVSEDKDRFEEAVQYVINGYPNSPIEDLKGDVSLLTVLSTPLAVTVVTSHCSEVFSLKQHVPGLMLKAISPEKLKKLVQASHCCSVRSGELAGTVPTLDTTQESNGHVMVEERCGTIRCDDGNEELSLRLPSLQSQVMMRVNEKVGFLESVFEEERRNKLGPKLDIYCQGMLSVCGSSVNLNNCHTQHGNILHAAAKYGLAESAKEALAQGYYNMLLELDNGKPNTWPLYYAVKHEDWLTVKVFLETLSSSQCQTQVRTMLEKIDCEKVIKEVRDYHKPWWVNTFHHEDLQKRLEVEGKSLLVKAILDTTVHGSDIDASLLLISNYDECKQSITVGDSSDQTDSGITKAPEKSLYKLISDSNVDELQCHPSFAAIVQHKWERGYVYVHGMLSILYIAYLIILTVALVLASKSSDPRQYNDGNDYLRMFFEILILLYILMVLIIDGIILLDDYWTHHNTEEKKRFLLDKVSMDACFKVVWYLSTLLIIPLRIADSSSQWHVASVAIILSGLTIFCYATVLPFMGQYVGTLCLIVKKDLPRLFIVFAVINFSFGSGLYFSLLGHYDDEHVDIVNDNSTSEIYMLWVTGVRMVIEGSVLTYTGKEGFNFSGRLIYWIFVFLVSVTFAAILIAQFETSYQHLATKAHFKVIRKKKEIMQKMDIFLRLFKCVPCIQTIRFPFQEKNGDEIRRQVMDDADNLDPKDYIVGKLSRKLAENDKRVQILGSKLDKMHELAENDERVQILEGKLDKIHELLMSLTKKESQTTHFT